MSAERWMPVVGYEGLYEVSDLGREFWPRTDTRRGARYLRIQLVDLRGDRKSQFVHVLVAAAFLGPKPDGLDVRHLDGDAANAALVNLAYGTRSENVQDTLRHGTHPFARRTQCKHGHPYPADGPRKPSGARRCRPCERRNSLAYKRRRASTQAATAAA